MKTLKHQITRLLCAGILQLLWLTTLTRHDVIMCIVCFIKYMYVHHFVTLWVASMTMQCVLDYTSVTGHPFNTLRPRQNSRHFPDIFKCILLNGSVWISNTISLKFVPKSPINDIPALVQIMAWRRPGDKPLSELLVIRLSTHMRVNGPQWIKRVSPFVRHQGYQTCFNPVISDYLRWIDKYIAIYYYATCGQIRF